MKSHLLKLGACLNCGRSVDAVSRLRDNFEPKVGSIMVCIYCSHVMEWDGKKLIQITDEGIKAIAGDKELLETLRFTKFYQQQTEKKK